MGRVRRLFGWMAGLAGIAALARVLSARRAKREARATSHPGREPDPADALREKLAETRGEPSETDDSLAETPTLDERRAQIHAKAQEAIDAMQEPPA